MSAKLGSGSAFVLSWTLPVVLVHKHLDIVRIHEHTLPECNRTAVDVVNVHLRLHVQLVVAMHLITISSWSLSFGLI